MARRRKRKTETIKAEAVDPKPRQSMVFVRSAGDLSWSEPVDVKILSRFGAGFDVSRECRLGTLILLELRLPAEMRAFDHDREFYSVVALVQNCNKVSGIESGYHLSVIFVGRDFPESYLNDPSTTYRLTGSSVNGLWNVTECAGQFKPRRFPRFTIKLDIELGLIRRNERMIHKETTYTYDVGASGLAAVSKLDAKRGDKVKIACREIDFFAIAVVVNRRNIFGEQDLLHLKFEEVKFPIERLLFSPARESAMAAE